LTDAKNVTLEGNHFYQTQVITWSSFGPILYFNISNAENFIFKNNFIGGSEKFAAGSTLQIALNGSSFSFFNLANSLNSSIQGNHFANINIMGANGATSIIMMRTSGTNTRIGDEIPNVIGSLSNNSSIVVRDCGTRGIVDSGTNTNISNNIIAGIESKEFLIGISKINGSGSIEGNTIANLNLTSNFNFNNTSTSSTGCIALESWPSSVTNNISGNYIYNIVNNSSSNTIGINVYGGTFANNIIDLKASEIGIVYGIRKIVSGTTYLYNNTVVVGGTVSAGNINSFALFDDRNPDVVRDYINNIFVNNTTNTGTATGKHYAIALKSSPGIIDYNNYHVSGTGGVLGLFNNVDKVTLGEWKASTTRDCFSTSLSPGFPTPSGVLTSNFMPTQSALVAKPIGTLTTDYLNVTRSTTAPAMGALEYTVTPSNDVFSITSFTPSSGASGTVVTITGVAFTGVTAVRFNGVNASSFTIVDNTTITATAPSNV
jgi:hypothetical protein